MGVWWGKLWKFTFYRKFRITLALRVGGVGNPANGSEASLASDIGTEERQKRHHCKR